MSTLSPFPVDWEPDTLGAFASLVPGKTPSRGEYGSAGDIKIIKFRDVTDSGAVNFGNDDGGWLNSTQVDGSDLVDLLPESILLTNAAHSLSHLGKKIGFVDSPPEGVRTCFVGELTSIRVKEPEDNSRWLYYLLQTKELRREIIKAAEGAHLVPFWLKRIPLSKPHRGVRNRIADTLKAADDHICAIEEQLHEADRVKRALLQTFPCVAKHGHGKPLFYVADISAGFTMGRDLSGNHTITVAYLTVVNVLDGALDLRNVSQAEIKQNELEELRLNSGDILMTEGGDRDKLGRGCIWEGQIDPIVCQNHIFRVRPDQSQIRPWFLHYLLQTPCSKRYFSSAAKQTSNLCTINSRDLRRFLIPELTPEEQDRWIDRIRGVDCLKKSLRQQLNAARRLKRSLLQNLITGKIRLKG